MIPLSSSLLASIEISLNAWLTLDGETLPKFSPLQDKVICLKISGLDVTLYCLPSAKHIVVMGEYTDIPDTTIIGSPMALIRLGTSNNSGKTLLESEVRIEGDTHLGATFSRILSEVDIDWEELLAKQVGDIVAHQVGQVTSTGKTWLHDSAEAMKLNTSEYISEEARLTPAEAEINYYLDQVDELRFGVDRLEARLHQHLKSS
ncbi:MAG: SCP2 sterol-binding domain-containing protein [Cocleimonas sp.]|nr:SCP2 sterol-binding domain-containing protein [Cocleimonas sp.]